METNKASLELYRHEAIEAAMGLMYGQKVIAKIHDAKDVAEIERIMVTARKGMK